MYYELTLSVKRDTCIDKHTATDNQNRATKMAFVFIYLLLDLTHAKRLTSGVGCAFD